MYFRHEPPVPLEGATSSVATDYVKRPNVFRLKLSNGGYYLFQAKDDVRFSLNFYIFFPFSMLYLKVQLKGSLSAGISTYRVDS